MRPFWCRLGRTPTSRTSGAPPRRSVLRLPGQVHHARGNSLPHRNAHPALRRVPHTSSARRQAGRQESSAPRGALTSKMA